MELTSKMPSAFAIATPSEVVRCDSGICRVHEAPRSGACVTITMRPEEFREMVIELVLSRVCFYREPNTSASSDRDRRPGKGK